MKDLESRIAASGHHKLKFYIYDTTFLVYKCDARRWARWIRHRDVRDLVIALSEERENTLSIRTALTDTTILGDVDYHDALVDAWILSLRGTPPASSLNVDRLRRNGTESCRFSLKDLTCALILHHDTEAALSEDGEPKYHIITRKEVRRLAVSYFSSPEKEPKDPLQLSDDEFCKKYHSHHEKSLPCYKTKSLPEER